MKGILLKATLLHRHMNILLPRENIFYVDSDENCTADFFQLKTVIYSEITTYLQINLFFGREDSEVSLQV